MEEWSSEQGQVFPQHCWSLEGSAAGEKAGRRDGDTREEDEEEGVTAEVVEAPLVSHHPPLFQDSLWILSVRSPGWHWGCGFVQRGQPGLV